MNATAADLLETIERSMPLLQEITNEAASVKPAPGKWSKKEIIGHLIDSAANNHQKFLHAMLEDGADFPPYEQDDWVSIQHYNTADWLQLLSLWKAYNIHLAHIMKGIDPLKLRHKIHIEDVGVYTLEFIVKDYPEHLKHHLMAILPDAGFKSNYK